jgi:uncharacterized membrane protein
MYNIQVSEVINQIVTFLSQVAGMIGIAIIIWGLFRGVIQLFRKATNNNAPFEKARLVLGQHLILGLDFLVAKDVIDTFLITDERIWIDLAKLGTVVTIRIVLNHFLEKEIHQLSEDSRKEFSRKEKRM